MSEKGPLSRMGLIRITKDVTFRDWEFFVNDMGDGFSIQPMFMEKDSDSGEEVICKGRKWYISTWATSEEVVKTCWLAVEIACRHEAMEAFRYQGSSIFHPHTGLNALIGAQGHPHVERPDPAVAVMELPMHEARCVCGVTESEHLLAGCGEWQRKMEGVPL